MVKHLACIMDGNRRWATKQGWIPWHGHRKGLDAVRLVVGFCLKKEIPFLTLYAFSTENLKRSKEEQDYLFEVLAKEAAREFEEFKRQNVRVRFIGDRSLFPKSVRSLCENLEKDTAHCDALQLNFLFCYGGQQEIVDTAKRIAIKVKKGDLQVADITSELFEHFLWTATMPSPDLIIRTGSHRRLSNFLSYQSAYSDFYFLDCLWPDISNNDLESAIAYYNDCQKNFGK